MAWKRPDNIPYPSIWSKFVGNKYPDMDPIEYKIQDITEDLFEDTIKHMTRYFLVKEKLCSSTGIIEDERSVNEIKHIWRNTFKQRMGLVALAVNHETGKEDIAGVNMISVVHKSEEGSFFFKDIRGSILKKVLKTLKDSEALINVFDKFNVSIYMTGLGMSVAPQYSGENIGYQLFMARVKLCRATGIPLIVSSFSSPVSQYLGTKAGFHTIAELNFKTYKQDGKLAFPKLERFLKLMAKEIDESTDN